MVSAFLFSGCDNQESKKPVTVKYQITGDIQNSVITIIDNGLETVFKNQVSPFEYSYQTMPDDKEQIYYRINIVSENAFDCSLNVFIDEPLYKSYEWNGLKDYTESGYWGEGLSHVTINPQ